MTKILAGVLALISIALCASAYSLKSGYSNWIPAHLDQDTARRESSLGSRLVTDEIVLGALPESPPNPTWPSYYRMREQHWPWLPGEDRQLQPITVDAWRDLIYRRRTQATNPGR